MTTGHSPVIALRILSQGDLLNGNRASHIRMRGAVIVESSSTGEGKTERVTGAYAARIKGSIIASNCV